MLDLWQTRRAKFMKLARAIKEHAAALNQAPLPADLLRSADMSTWSFQIELSIFRAHDPKTARVISWLSLFHWLFMVLVMS